MVAVTVTTVMLSPRGKASTSFQVNVWDALVVVTACSLGARDGSVSWSTKSYFET
ncbi:hypothetical protein D3C72_2474990 [compost metagenome]